MKEAVRVGIENTAIARFSCVMTTKVKPGLYVMCNCIVLIYLLPISCAGNSHDIYIITRYSLLLVSAILSHLHGEDYNTNQFLFCKNMSSSICNT
jgi:hypothetical protein